MFHSQTSARYETTSLATMPHKTKSILLALAATHALVPRANPKNSRLQRTRLHEKPIDSDEMASLYQELRARQSDVEADRAQT